MDKIESLFSQWKESSPKLNKANDKSMEIQKFEECLDTKHAEIQKFEESLSEIIETREEERTKSKDFDEEILIEEADVSS